MATAKAPSHSGTNRRVQKQKSWSNLTNSKKLKHISNLVDKALEDASRDGSISSLQDFKDFVESYSEKHSKHPIVMELCEGTDGEIRGFRFYLASNPEERTSGKYLALNLQKHGVEIDENKYTPSAIMENLGIDEFENDVESEEFESDIEDKLEKNSNLDLELDDELTPQTAKLPIQRQNGKQNAKSKSIDKQIEDFQQSISEDELDDLLNDSDLNLEADESSPAPAPQKTKSKSKSKSKTELSNDKPQPVNDKSQERKDDQIDVAIEEMSNIGARAAVSGHEVNGINVAGLATQLAALGFAVGENIFKSLENTDSEQQKRLQQILDLIQEQAERVEELDRRQQRVQSFTLEPEKAELTKAESKADRILETIDKQEQRTQQLAERVENLQIAAQPLSTKATPDKNLANEVNNDELPTEPAQTFTPKRQAQRLTAENTVEDTIGVATNQLADKVNQLSDSLGEKSKSLPPIKLNSNASLDDKLDQIENYLNQLVKRIDALEQRIETLEQQAGIDFHTEEKSFQVQSGVSQKEPEDKSKASASLNSTEESLEGRAANPQQTAVANSLMAFVYSAHTEDVIQSEDVLCCSVPPDKTVYVDQSSTESISISLKDKASRQIFTAVSGDGSSWKVLSDSLSAQEIDNIRTLPQTPEAFEKQQLAQEFLDNFKEQYPELFNGEGESIVRFTNEEGEPTYEFELSEDKTQKTLSGYDLVNEEEQVFKATSRKVGESSKEEIWKIEQCDLPEEIVALLNDSLNSEEESLDSEEEDQDKEVVKSGQNPARSRHSDKEIEI